MSAQLWREVWLPYAQTNVRKFVGGLRGSCVPLVPFAKYCGHKIYEVQNKNFMPAHICDSDALSPAPDMGGQRRKVTRKDKCAYLDGDGGGLSRFSEKYRSTSSRMFDKLHG